MYVREGERQTDRETERETERERERQIERSFRVKIMLRSQRDIRVDGCH
jgi:hypothetical protein